MELRRSTLPQLTAPDAFLWCTGIEDTFITAPWPKTGRTLDEYELTGHYDRWADDLGLMADLGVPAARYGLPWHRLCPRRGVWDWDFADRAIDRLLALNVAPIIDLVHYGLPPWIEGAFLHPDFPVLMADYAARVATRFRDRVHAYTPLNEPRITAWYCGRLGWWPPFRRGWRGFVAVLLAACRGIVETCHALHGVDADILPVHVDATDLYETLDPTLADEAARRQEIVFLALDLVTGRVGAKHPLAAWLRQNGVTDDELAWFQRRPVDLPLLGINLYPMFSRKVLTRSAAGRLRIRMPYSSAAIVERLARLYSERYGAPLFVSETASVGRVSRRAAWLDASVASVARTRAAGLPLIGYTWWPLFALVTWGYRQGTRPPREYLLQMGLWNLDANLDRLPTPLVEQFRTLVTARATSVGTLAALRAPSPGGGT